MMDRKAILAHLRIAPLYLSNGCRIEARRYFQVLRFDGVKSEVLADCKTLNDAFALAAEVGAL